MASRRNKKAVARGHASFDALAALNRIQTAIAHKSEPLPPGYLTVVQWGEAWKCTTYTASRRLKRAEAASVAKLRIFRNAAGQRVRAYFIP